MQLPKEVQVEGVGKVRLHPQNDYLGQGGQAIIYKVGTNLVAKLYYDEAATAASATPILTPAVLQQGDMIGKLKTLMRLKDDRIIRPQGLVTDLKGTPLGYTMAWVKGVTLPETFANGFWRDNGWSGKEAVHLAESLRELLAYAHTQQALVVDGNPANYLAVNQPQGWQPRALDVDSWKIDQWPASAYHDLTRDPHTTSFTTLTDWFGWGTVVCQLLLGVHPYGGRLAGFKPHDIVGRMRAGKSIFDPGVALGSGVRDINLVPPVLLHWLKDTYAGNTRTVPPSLYASAPTLPRVALVMRMVATAASGTLVFTKLFEVLNDPVQRIYPHGIVRLRSGAIVSLTTKKVMGHAQSPLAQVVRQQGGWLLADVQGGQLVFSWLTEAYPPQPITNLPVPYGELMQAQTGPQVPADRLGVSTPNGWQELKVTQLGARALLGYGQLWPSLGQNTRWYDGCGIQQTLGRVHLLMPYGPNHYTVLDVPELRGLKPLAAKAGYGIVFVVATDKAGQLQRLMLVLTPDYKGYQATTTAVDSADLNVTFRPDSSYRTIWEDGMFTASNPRLGQEKTWQDKGVQQAMPLASWSNITVYEQGGAVWSLAGK
jgi:hypothetical protein